MEIKATHPVKLIDNREISPFIRAYFEFNQLKQLYRQGWLRRGVPKERCESVAEHSLGVAVLACWLADAYYPQLDQSRVMRLALIHDFGEIYAGDIIPGDEVSTEEKYCLELESVERVFSRLPNGVEYIALWGEFEAGQTPEARFVRQVDRLEMGLQASVYEHQGNENLSEFYGSARGALFDPQLIELLQEVIDLRDEST